MFPDTEQKECKTLQREDLLHDVGKIGIPDAVLNKPGRLTEAEASFLYAT